MCSNLSKSLSLQINLPLSARMHVRHLILSCSLPLKTRIEIITTVVQLLLSLLIAKFHFSQIQQGCHKSRTAAQETETIHLQKHWLWLWICVLYNVRAKIFLPSVYVCASVCLYLLIYSCVNALQHAVEWRRIGSGSHAEKPVGCHCNGTPLSVCLMCVQAVTKGVDGTKSMRTPAHER